MGSQVDRVEDGRPNDVVFDHAWKWFEYHAAQRMSLLRFFLITTGAVTAAYATAFKANLFGLAIGAAIFGAIASYLFLCLDKRTARLIRLGEDILRREQQRLMELVQYDEILIIESSDREESGFLGSYRQILIVFFWLTIAIYLFAISFAFYKFVCGS